MASGHVRWGICGTGGIAAKFAADLRFVPHTSVTAVGSRTPEAAEAFGRRFGVPHTYGSYESLARAGTADVIYVATPQSRHHADVLMFLRAGKAVLCEKPFAMSLAEAEEMVAAARAAGRFLMEAMWMRFLPAHQELRALLADGAIGRPDLVLADFGFRADPVRHRRLLDPALGGGSLLDLGVYPVSLASMILGRPARVTALGQAHPGAGVDGQTGVLLGYPAGRMAVLHSSILGETPGLASVTGPAGRITVERPFHAARALVRHSAAGPVRVDRPFPGTGLHFEAAEVVHCLRTGQPESEIMPLSETLAVMHTLDEIRRQSDHADGGSGAPPGGDHRDHAGTPG